MFRSALRAVRDAAILVVLVPVLFVLWCAGSVFDRIFGPELR